jgi:hypothetical protein
MELRRLSCSTIRQKAGIKRGKTWVADRKYELIAGRRRESMTAVRCALVLLWFQLKNVTVSV